MNIIKKTGSAIAKNREAAKAILTTHGISYGAGKNSDLIKAAFVAIKGGNTELATDLAGLIELNKSKTPGEKKNSLSLIRDRIIAIREKLKKLKPVTPANENSGDTVISVAAESAVASNADGVSDPIEANAAELTATVQAGDPEVLSSEALNAFIIAPAILLSISFILIIILMIYGVGKFAKA